MSKGKDPAFLFYPGDASEDTQFMNRLERGGYFDLLKAQKKFRRFNIDLVKKVLGSDFVKIWPAIESVLCKDEEYYYIGWVHSAIENRAEHSAKQKKRIAEYWDRERKKKESESNPDLNHGTTTEQPTNNQNDSLVNENEIVIENAINKIKKRSRKKIVLPHPTEGFKMTWAKWKAYRAEIKKPYRSVSSEQMALDRLGAHPESVAIEMIQTSIANQWQGIFELKHNGSRKQTPITKNDRSEFNQNELAIIQQHGSGS